MAESAEVTELAGRIARNDERSRALGKELRRAHASIGALLCDLPLAMTDLYMQASIDDLRLLRDESPEEFAFVVSTVGQKCSYAMSRLLADRVGAPGIGGAASRDPLPGYTLASIWEDYEPPRYLVKCLLAPAAVTVLFGQSGHLKSVTAIDLALCVATGTTFHDIKTRRAGVLYVAGEGHAGIRKRIRAWLMARGMDSTSEQPAVYVTSAGADLTGNPEQLRATVTHAAQALGMPIAVIIVDTLAACFGAADENLSGDMGRAIAGARAADPEAAVLLVHHTGHGNVERERGSYALVAAADYRLQATYDDVVKQLELKWHKCKDDEKPEPMVFECKRVALEWQDEDGVELTSVVLEHLEGASVSPAKHASELGKHDLVAMKALQALYARNRKALADEGRQPSEAKIRIAEWRGYCEKKGMARQRWYEVIKSLTDGRLVLIDDPFAMLVEAA